MNLVFSLSMNPGLVRKVRAETRAREARITESIARRAEMLGKDDGYLRATETGYDFGSNPDPDGIMATNRDPTVAVPRERVPAPAHDPRENRANGRPVAASAPVRPATEDKARKVSPKTAAAPSETEKRAYLERVIAAPKRSRPFNPGFPQFGGAL